MNEASSSDSVRDIVRRIARQHLEAAHPERLEELDVVFDSAFAAAVQNAPATPSPDSGTGLPFETSFLDLSVVGFTVASALQLVQIARLNRRVAQLTEIVQRTRGLPKARRKELEQIAGYVIREATTWRPGHRAEPIAVDSLQLIVRRSERHGRPLLEFQLHGEAGGRSYSSQSFGETALDKSPEAYFQELFRRIVPGPPGSGRDPKVADRWVRTRGAHLAALFLPERLRTELITLARTGGSLLVVSDEPWVPWEMLWLGGEVRGREGGFLSEMFALARWQVGSSPPGGSICAGSRSSAPRTLERRRPTGRRPSCSDWSRGVGDRSNRSARGTWS